GLGNAFAITNGFVDGVNTLEFVVNNAGTTANPTALRAELSGTADFLAPPGTPPSIVTHPVSLSVGQLDPATFTVSAYGSRPLSYQWRLDGEPIDGATEASYTIANASSADEGSYDVIVTNEFGMAMGGPATLTVVFLSPAQLTYEPLGPSTRRTELTFSEVMYHPAPNADGRRTEFIEIYNSNPFFEDVSGWRLSGDIDYTLPDNTVIQGNSFLVVAPSPADVEAVYGITGVVGGFTNNLPNNGGTVRLRKRAGGIVLQLDYSDQSPWPVAADGPGHSLVLARPSYGENNPAAWAASASKGGSPGAADPLPVGLLENVVINEILAHTDLPQLDYVELFNHSTQPVDLSGCWLSDDPDTNKFRIPDGTMLGARGFVSFTETELGFALSADGETLYLVNADETRVLAALRFEGQANGISFGRYPDGAPGFQELTAITPGTTNAPVLLRDVVINEIMYNPLSGEADDEYVELHNRGAQTVNVGGWRFVEGISFTFPDNTQIPAQGYLVVARNASRLMTNYAGLSSANLVGNFGGNLANGGERLALAMPDTLLSTNATTGAVTTNLFFIVVDEVTYVDGGRWGKWSDGGGSSLELKDAHADNRQASNWADSDETAKAGWTVVEHTGVLDIGTGPAPINASVPASELQVTLFGAGEALVDDVEVLISGVNRIPNPSFESGATGWFWQGTHSKSFLDTGEGYNSANSLRLRTSDRGDVA
ncbi:MAG TPA: lamin tail domain-containing protein, partial [Verrucomicrobiae bacterium]|nr:lamin tail domain-containing protein [Verrucomicrobiae bacterium]